jgi:indole-3-glycerol phosphate synthase
MSDYLSAILARKRRENSRRRRHVAAMRPVERPPQPKRSEQGIRALRRAPGEPPSVIAEVKFRSPSAGEIRPRSPGEGVRVAQGYERGGASAVSVLADGPGFGGSPLLVRRVAQAVSVPVLYKGFVLDPIQVDLAYDVGASLVLLLVRALEDSSLRSLIENIRALGMEPVVEAANADEVDRAVAAGSTIVGVNARDLSTFRVDKNAARASVARIPEPCVAVFMSGVRSAEDFRDVARGRTDAVLIGEWLMHAEDPGARLSELLGSV